MRTAVLPDGSVRPPLEYLSWLYRAAAKGALPDEWFESVWATLQCLWSGGGRLDSGLALETLRRSSARAGRAPLLSETRRSVPGGSWADVWNLFSAHLPADGEMPSWRWRGLLALLENGGTAVLRDLGTRPGFDAFVARQFYGNDYDPMYFAPEMDGYPRRAPSWGDCLCADCNNPTYTGEFLDPRSLQADRPHFEDFGPPEQRAFLDLFPRELLEWSLDAWQFEAAFDAEVSEIAVRRRALLVRGAEESLRWASPGRECRAAWLGAVARARPR